MQAFDRWMTGWRGAALAALLAMIAGLPGLFALPLVDGYEARFAQASVHMTEGDGLTVARFQADARPTEPPGAHWAQSLSVWALSSSESRQIWAHRLPSLLGTMTAAAALVLGGAALFGARAAFLAAALFAFSGLSISLSAQATADGLLTGASALVLAALASLYAAGRSGGHLRKRHRIILWAGLAAGLMVGGPVALVIPALALAALLLADRGGAWALNLGWGWGGLLLLACFGGWLSAAMIETDGKALSAAWLVSAGGGLGLQSLSAPALLFPAALALPFALIHAWQNRDQSGVRIALAWLAGWLVLELTPGWSLHGAAVLYAPIFWLGAAGLASRKARWPTRLAGAGLSLAAGTGLAGLCLWLTWGGQGDKIASAAAAALLVTAGLAGGLSALTSGATRPLVLTLLLGLAGQWAFVGLALPLRQDLWPARMVLGALTASDLDPRGGLARGPVAVAGYDSPALVFALGGATELGRGGIAARALADGRPAIVEAAEVANLHLGLSILGARAELRSQLEARPLGRDQHVRLNLYGPANAQPE